MACSDQAAKGFLKKRRAQPKRSVELKHNITRALYSRALESPRFRGHNPSDAMQRTLDELWAVYRAVASGDVAASERAMREHIDVGWERRRIGPGPA